MPVICGMDGIADAIESTPVQPAVKPEFCVLRSPMDAQCIVARPGEHGTAGWQTLHGPDTSEGCWAWIHSKPRHGLRF